MPSPSRYITTHTPSGDPIFSSLLPLTAPLITRPSSTLSYLYTTSRFPATLTREADLLVYASSIDSSPPNVVVPGGTSAIFVELDPGAATSMHRTVSIDYAVVLEGAVELELGHGGERRRLGRWDAVVQRGTVHRWHAGPEGVKMFIVTQSCEPVEVEGGRVLEEEWQGKNADAK